MSSKDKKSVKSDKSKDKKKKSTKPEKKEVIPPPESEQQLFIARVVSRPGDKESKIIANSDVENPYMQTQSTFSPKRNNNLINENQSATYPLENYNTVPYAQNNIRANKFMAETNQFQEYQQHQFTNNQMPMPVNPINYPYSTQPYNYQGPTQPQNTRQQYFQQPQQYQTNDFRFDRMKDQINMGLLPKKQEIISQLQKVDDRIDEIKFQASQIEQLTREECELAIDRLRSVETLKLQQLFHDKNELIKDIDQIDKILQRFQQVQDYTTPQNIDLFEGIERQMHKKIKQQIEVYSDDLPQDFINIKRIQQQNQMLSKLMEFKNEVIWKLFNDQQVENKKIQEDFRRQANLEFQEWQNMVDQFQQELNKYKLKCAFCGINFDYQLINTTCNVNQVEARVQWECEENPPQEFIGSQRHYFSKPKQLQQSHIQLENSKV